LRTSSKRASAALILAICIRLMAPSIMRAPPEQETITSGSFLAMQRSMARVIFSPTTAPILPPMKLNSMALAMSGLLSSSPSPVSRASFMPVVFSAFFSRSR
jgi:hypothetical protein